MEIHSAIVGYKYHEGATDHLIHTPPGDPVEVRREPDNPHDPNAIRCYVRNVFCGFIPKDQAALLAVDMDEGRTVTAELYDFNKLRITVTRKEDDHGPDDDATGGQQSPAA